MDRDYLKKVYCVLLDKDEPDEHDLSLWNYLLPKFTQNIIYLHATKPIELVFHEPCCVSDADVGSRSADPRNV